MRARISIDKASWARAQLELRNVAKVVPSNARKTMRRAAERIVRRARIYVPEDTGELRDSIRIEATYGERGRLQINVVAGGDIVVNAQGRTITLDQYAAIIHEHYDQFEPGPRTVEKMRQYPGLVGGFFLDRAAEDEREKLERDMIEGVTNAIRRGLR